MVPVFGSGSDCWFTQAIALSIRNVGYTCRKFPKVASTWYFQQRLKSSLKFVQITIWYTSNKLFSVTIFYWIFDISALLNNVCVLDKVRWKFLIKHKVPKIVPLRSMGINCCCFCYKVWQHGKNLLVSGRLHFVLVFLVHLFQFLYQSLTFLTQVLLVIYQLKYSTANSWKHSINIYRNIKMLFF